jgi:hypothetical protein
MSSYQRRSTRARSSALFARQLTKARLAASIARRVSTAVASGTVLTSAPVAGLRTCRTAPLSALTHWPSI